MRSGEGRKSGWKLQRLHLLSVLRSPAVFRPPGHWGSPAKALAPPLPCHIAPCYGTKGKAAWHGFSNLTEISVFHFGMYNEDSI